MHRKRWSSFNASAGIHRWKRIRAKHRFRCRIAHWSIKVQLSVVAKWCHRLWAIVGYRRRIHNTGFDYRRWKVAAELFYRSAFCKQSIVSSGYETTFVNETSDSSIYSAKRIFPDLSRQVCRFLGETALVKQTVGVVVGTLRRGVGVLPRVSNILGHSERTPAKFAPT